MRGKVRESLESGYLKLEEMFLFELEENQSFLVLYLCFGEKFFNGLADKKRDGSRINKLETFLLKIFTAMNSKELLMSCFVGVLCEIPFGNSGLHLKFGSLSNSTEILIHFGHCGSKIHLFLYFWVSRFFM